MVKQYALSTQIVDAIQWNGNNAVEITNFVNRPTFVSMSKHIFICLQDNMEDVVSAAVGDYIVVDKKNGIIVVPQVRFNFSYLELNTSSVKSNEMVVPEITHRNRCIDTNKVCDMCGKHNKITLIYNDKFYCKECSKKVLKRIE